MPRLNARGSALMGVGSSPGSVDGRVIITPGAGCWLDDETIAVNTEIGGHWCVLEINVVTGAQTVLRGDNGANDLCGNSGRWLGWAADIGLFGSLGSKPAAGLVAAGLDGTLAYCPDRQVGIGVVLVAPNGTETAYPAVVARELQVLGPASAVWYGGAVVGRSALRPAVPPGRMRVVEVAGETWLVYWSEGVGLIAQVDGATDGYILETRPLAFNHDAVAVGTDLVVAWSTTQGEGPNDLVKVTVNRTLTRVPLVIPVASLPRIDRTIWFGGFTGSPNQGGGWSTDTDPRTLPGNCYTARGEILTMDGHRLGWYVQGARETDSDSIDTAILAARIMHPGEMILAEWPQDAWTHKDANGNDVWRVPAGADEGVVAYQRVGESDAAFEARVRVAVAHCKHPWLIPQCFTSNSAFTANLRGVAVICARIARDTGCHVLAFNFDGRKTGLQDHPEMLPVYTALAATVTTPTLPAPVPTPAPIPTPVPVPVPVPVPPPVPVGSYRHHKENYMADTLGVLRGPGGKLARPDGPNTGPWAKDNPGKGWRGLVFDGLDKTDARYHFLRPAAAPDSLVSQETGALVGCDGTSNSGGLDKMFYVKPDGDTGKGWAETFQFYDGNANGAIEAQVEYSPGSGGDDGAFFSYSLAFEVIS